jgi:glycosyltransferase involved in cell wall biosynthesis
LNNPLISVIIPCYNVGDCVEKAVASIVQQSYRNLEIWIIDDASTDDTMQKILGFTDERIRIISKKENTQKIGAVNEVLQQVKGEFICFQDADDWSEPDRLQSQVDQFIKYPTLGICFTGYRYIGDEITVPERIALIDEELKDEFLEFGHKKNISLAPTICATMMITRDVLKKTGGYHSYFTGRLAEDIQWVYRILKDYPGLTINKPLYNYFWRESSFTGIQFSGKNAKYSYSWQLLAKIIYKDLHENIDILDPRNIHELKKLELQACEEALVEQIKFNNTLRQIYENSSSFRIGKFLLTPFRLLKNKRS